MRKKTKQHYISQYDMKNFGTNFNIYSKERLIKKENRSPKSIFLWWKCFDIIDENNEIDILYLEDLLAKIENQFKSKTDQLITKINSITNKKFDQKELAPLISQLFHIITSKTKPSLIDARENSLKSFKKMIDFYLKMTEMYNKSDSKVEWPFPDNTAEEIINNYTVEAKYKENFAHQLMEKIMIISELQKDSFYEEAYINIPFFKSKLYILKNSKEKFIFNDYRYANLSSDLGNILIFPISSKYCVLSIPFDFFTQYEENIIEIDPEFLNFINNSLVEFSLEEYSVEINNSNPILNEYLKKIFIKLEPIKHINKPQQFITIDRRIICNTVILFLFLNKKIGSEKFLFTVEFHSIKKAFIKAQENIKNNYKNYRIYDSLVDKLQKEFHFKFYTNTLTLNEINNFENEIINNLLKIINKN